MVKWGVYDANCKFWYGNCKFWYGQLQVLVRSIASFGTVNCKFWYGERSYPQANSVDNFFCWIY